MSETAICPETSPSDSSTLLSSHDIFETPTPESHRTTPTSCVLSRFLLDSSTICAKQQQAPPDTPVVPRIDSLISLYRSGGTLDVPSHGRDAGVGVDREPLVMNLLVNDQVFVKELDYTTFGRWTNMEAVLKDFQDDGMEFHELWDVHEDMLIGSGDWDARIRPGSKIVARCGGLSASPHDDDSSCSSEDGERDWDIDRLELIDDTQHMKKHWWFARWNSRVEKETCGSGKVAQEPTPKALLVGTFFVVLMFAIVLIFSAL